MRRRQAETEATAGIFELHRAQSKISQNAVDRRQPTSGVQCANVSKIPLHQHQLSTVAAQAFSNNLERLGVTVDCQQSSLSPLQHT